MREIIRKILNKMKSPAIGKIWQSTRGQRGRLFLLSALNAVGALIGLGFTLIMRNLVDAAVARELNKVYLYALTLAGVILVQMGSGYIRRILSMKISSGLLQSMRAESIRELLHKEYASLKNRHSGELVNRIFSDVSVVADGIINIVPSLLYLTVQLVGASVIILRMSGVFMLILLISGAVGASASYLLRHKMKSYHKASQAAQDKLHARIQETLENMRIIKATSLQERMEREANEAQNAYTASVMRRTRFSALVSILLGLIFRGSWLYALLWGCNGIYTGAMTYGTLTAILQLVGQIQSPFEGIISMLGSAYATVSSAERLMELYELPNEPERLPADRHVIDTFTGIEVNNVSFHYDDEADALNDFSLTIRRGETLAVMGVSGSGKSTLFSLLLGIYEPNKGTVSIVKENGEKCGLMRDVFAYVPQGNQLFSGTIRDNIAMFSAGNPTEEEIWQAAETACIADFVRGLKNGMDTPIGEHGIGLSEGQAQRVAIARALLTGCPVLLLDESTSALDEKTEADVLRNIAGLRDKTCVIVTHRRAALEICTRTVSIRDGRISAC